MSCRYSSAMWPLPSLYLESRYLMLERLGIERAIFDHCIVRPCNYKPCYVAYHTRSSATAEKQRASCPVPTRPSSPLPLFPLWLHLCVWSNPKSATNVRQAHFKMNWAFKVIRGHPYWCRQESRTVCFRNVQFMSTLFLKLTKITQV